MQQAKVWYVTDASKGFGLSLVRTLIQSEYRVAATSRHIEELKQAVVEVRLRSYPRKKSRQALKSMFLVRSTLFRVCCRICID